MVKVTMRLTFSEYSEADGAHGDLRGPQYWGLSWAFAVSPF